MTKYFIMCSCGKSFVTDNRKLVAYFWAYHKNKGHKVSVYKRREK